MRYDYLIIAEKKTLAEDIAKAFKSRKKNGNFIEVSDPQIGTGKITWLFGHILEADINKTLEKFSEQKGAPVFPPYLILKPKSERKKLFNDIKKEIESGKWKYIVHAGDPDREGELLVREVLNYLKVPKEKVLRLWFNSQDKEALRKALLSMKPLKEYDHVYTAGLARQLGDFHFGINATRKLQERTKDKKISLGRVQTPTLKLIVDRYLEHVNFKPEEYYVIYALFEKGKKVKATYQKKKEGLLKKEDAEKIIKDIKGEQFGTVREVKKKTVKKKPPKMYILSSLIKDAGKYGFNAQKTQSTLQRLYEHYKCVSYPRTESPYLSKEDLPEIEKALTRIGRKDLIPIAKKLHQAYVSSKKANNVFNDKSVAEAGHHAIIPLDKLPENATKDERLIYNLILKRFLAQFYPEYIYEKTDVLFDVKGHLFKASGKVDKQLGWMELYKGTALEKEDENKEEEDNQSLPEFTKGEKVKKLKEWTEKRMTTPPPLFTSASLVDMMKKLGIGTEATRGSYEARLIEKGYIKRDRRNRLYPTEKGIALIEKVKNMPFVSPEMTASWEQVLDRIFKKREVGLKKEFLEGVRKLTIETVSHLEKIDISDIKKKASDKMKYAVLKIAKEKGIEIDKSKLDNFEYCASIIESHKDVINKPSEKQIEFAKKLAQEKGIELDSETLNDKNKLSKWIDKILKEKKKEQLNRPLTEKQVQVIQKYGDDKVKKALEKGDFATCRKWLDKFFKKGKTKRKRAKKG